MENPTTKGREIVEVYCRRDYRETVEQYCRPLPETMRPPAPRRAKKRKRTGLWVFLGCLAALLCVAGGMLMWQWYNMPDEGDDPGDFWPCVEEEVSIPTWPTGQGVRLELDEERGEVLTPQEVYKAVNPSTVTVTAQLRSSTSVGTGVIFTEDGYVVTNYHVISGGRYCAVMLEDGAVYAARYVAGDAENDLAVLKMIESGYAGPLSFPAARFGDSDALEVGDPVYAIGNPLGVELRGTFTNGIVSAVDRDVEIHEKSMTLIQTNAALNTGNSGGPLIDQYGRVVGINVIKMDSEDSTVEGLGFAIPSSVVRRMVNDLLETGAVQPEPSIGIMVPKEGTLLEAGLMGLEAIQVIPDTPAEKAGILEGDYVLAVGGVPVSTSRELLAQRREYHVGDTMTLTIWRSGEIFDVTLELTDAFTKDS